MSRSPAFSLLLDNESYVAAKNLFRRLMQRGYDGAVAAAWGDCLIFQSRAAVLGREEARGHARGGVDLRVDVLDVVACRLRRDHELGGDLLARQAARDQPQDVDLAGRQPGRPLAAARDRMAGRGENRGDRLGVELAGSRVGLELARRACSALSAGRCGRGSRIDRYASTAPRIRAGREIAPPASPFG